MDPEVGCVAPDDERQESACRAPERSRPARTGEEQRRWLVTLDRSEPDSLGERLQNGCLGVARG